MERRYHPVILLLDVSASMKGEPIRALHDAVGVMVDTFAKEVTRERMIAVAIITFGADGAVVHTPYTDASELQNKGVPALKAKGGTLLYEALTLAKDMIEDKAKTPGRWYEPSVVLVSDGHPAGGWEKALNSFVQTGRTARCLRIGVPIGAKADEDMMLRFTGNKAMIFHAQDASKISDAFRNVVLSVTKSFDKAQAVSSQPTVKRDTLQPTEKRGVLQPTVKRDTLQPTVKRNVPTTIKRPVRHNDEDEE